MEKLQSSAEWWYEVCCSAQKFSDWLQKQYHGESTAAARIREMASQTKIEAHKFILEKITSQGDFHANLVKDLLETYEMVPLPAEEFGTTVESVQEDFSTMCAIAGHAKAMRLERIRAIVDDIDTPTDVYAVFCIILQDEVWHEQAFKVMAGEEALSKVKPCHDKARRLLGLEV